jgi:hypothetical protein
MAPAEDMAIKMKLQEFADQTLQKRRGMAQSAIPSTRTMESLR